MRTAGRSSASATTCSTACATRGTAFMDVDARLRLNDHLGIELQLLSPNPITYFHHVEADVADGFCRWHNDELAAVVAGHPDRFVGAAQLPMQDPALAAAELRRAVGDLGLRAAYIGTDFGLDLDDERLDVLWSTAVELDVPVFIHPAPWGIDGPLRDERIRRFDLDLSIGFMYEETLAIACLIFGGVLDRHPGLDVCMSHGGGASAYMFGRLAAPGSQPTVGAGGTRRLRRRTASAVVRQPPPRRRRAGAADVEGRRRSSRRRHKPRRLGRADRARSDPVGRRLRRQRPTPAPALTSVRVPWLPMTLAVLGCSRSVPPVRLWEISGG